VYNVKRFVLHLRKVSNIYIGVKGVLIDDNKLAGHFQMGLGSK